MIFIGLLIVLLVVPDRHAQAGRPPAAASEMGAAPPIYAPDPFLAGQRERDPFAATRGSAQIQTARRGGRGARSILRLLGIGSRAARRGQEDKDRDNNSASSIFTPHALAVTGLLLTVIGLLGFATFQFVRGLFRLFFVEYRDAEVVGARVTRKGRFRPVVEYVNSHGRTRTAIAPFETRRDPRGNRAAVAIMGHTETILRHPRSFWRATGHILLTLGLAVGLFTLGYVLDTGGL